jgi:hypothetical protein
MLYIRALAVIVLATVSVQAMAETTSTFKKEEGQIPQIPSAPPSLLQRAPEQQYFHCERAFVYQGKMLECDSNVARDGERLRPILQDTPAALDELNTYQRNRRNVRTAAYITTLGVALMLAGYAINRPPFENFGFPLGEITIKTGGYFVLSGMALSIGGVIYALSVTKTNDQHLQSAVTNFNQAHPNQPIELQFKTGISF